MKSFIITVLLLALLAAAFFTRPGREDFKRYIVQQQTKDESNVIKKAIAEEVAKTTAESCTLKDRYLWTEIQQDGKTVYTGAFAHWFNRGEVKNKLDRIEQKSRDGLDKLEQKIPKPA